MVLNEFIIAGRYPAAEASVGEHLIEAVRAVLDRPKEERIRVALSQCWIGYRRADTILQSMEDLLLVPPKARMPNLLLVGEANNGKTTLVERFRSRYPKVERRKEETDLIPIIYVVSPPGASDARLFDRLLRELAVEFSERATVGVKEAQLYDVAPKVGLRMIIIDEIHNLITGVSNKQLVLCNTIKGLSNELRIPIILVGTPAAHNAINIDDQMASRWPSTTLPTWECDDEYRRMLAGIETHLPLRLPSRLSRRTLANTIHKMAEGRLGETFDLLQRAAVSAIRNGDEHIHADLLESIPWTRPSQRPHTSV